MRDITSISLIIVYLYVDSANNKGKCVREKYVSSCLFENKRKMSIKNSKSMVQYIVRKNIYNSGKKMIDGG